MITANEFKNGVVIKYNNQLYQIQWFQHVKMQQRFVYGGESQFHRGPALSLVLLLGQVRQ